MPLNRNFEQLKDCDLNLLIALSVLLKEAHVTKAAKQLNLSQSAMSQVLKRLRLMFEDPLLVKGHNGMTLTNKALSIEQDLKPLLVKVIELLETGDFDPKTARGRIRFIMNDATAQLCIAPLLSRMNELAPNLEIEYLTQRRDGFQELRRGQVDLIVGFYDNVPKPIQSMTLALANWQMVSLSHDFAVQQGEYNVETGLKLLRYQYQEHNQIHVINALKKINAQEASYALTSGSLSTMIQALKTENTATLIPHYITELLSEYEAESFNWLGEPIALELKLCWNSHSRNAELQKWFRKELSDILQTHLTIESMTP